MPFVGNKKTECKSYEINKINKKEGMTRGLEYVSG